MFLHLAVCVFVLRPWFSDLKFRAVSLNVDSSGAIIHCQVLSTSSTVFAISLSVKSSAEVIEDCDSEALVADILAWKSSCVGFTCRAQLDVSGVWLSDGFK